MKFLIAGLGSIGTRHARNLIALGERDLVFFRTHKSTISAPDLQLFPLETELSAALSHEPDAVIVCTPTALHLDVAIPAAQAGCHLFIEKPISNNLDRIDELVEIVKSKGLKATIGFHFRCHPGLQKVKSLIETGAIGRSVWAQAHWGEYLPDWHPWEDYRTAYSARSDLGGGG